MGDSSFYKRLEIVRGITKRRELISQLLKNSDLVSLFGEEVKNAKLLEDLAIPSDPMNKLSLPFAVGFKYGLKNEGILIERVYTSGIVRSPSGYILGIVRFPSGEKSFLTVCDDEMFYCLRRSHLINPLYT